MFLYE
jgi:hypothetical protein